MDIKRFLFDKLFVPRVIKTNLPGVITTKVVSKYGRKSSVIRPAYIFEDILVDLQLDTLKIFVKEKTERLWYRIGKDMISSYFLVSGARKPPKILFEEVLKYILTRISISGMSVGTDINFDNKNFSLLLRGRDNVICRKSGIGSVHAGLVSGIVSFLSGENIEALKTKCSSKGEDFCEIVSNKNIPFKYEVDYNRIRNAVSNYRLVSVNGREEVCSRYNYLATFDRFMKFDKIKIINNITYFYKIPLISGEINTADHIVGNYKREDLLPLFEESLLKSSERILRKITGNKELSLDDGLRFVQNMMSAFGWGIPVYRKERDKIIFDFIFGASAEADSFLFYALQLNGFLNYIYEKKLKLKEVKQVYSKVPISRVVFEL